MLSQSKIGEMLSVQVRCYALSDQIFGHHGESPLETPTNAEEDYHIHNDNYDDLLKQVV